MYAAFSSASILAFSSASFLAFSSASFLTVLSFFSASLLSFLRFFLSAFHFLSAFLAFSLPPAHFLSIFRIIILSWFCRYLKNSSSFISTYKHSYNMFTRRMSLFSSFSMVRSLFLHSQFSMSMPAILPNTYFTIKSCFSQMTCQLVKLTGDSTGTGNLSGKSTVE